jgi:exonuclease SbcC
MLPLKLSIEGLYSYQKKQLIDFQELTQAGLFGIFGAVGSGKSSILEAIGFVLYGDTERLNKSDKRSYNMLNLKSNQANIEFEFLNFEDRKFKFVAHWKRKKKFGDTTTIERLAYECKNQEWIPLESADATELIGLTYENFRRTIIIPQGKFKEFLDLKGKDRSDMMKEIFHLQKFDLSAKVSTLQFATKSQLDQLKGALSGYETISDETLLLKMEEKKVAENALLQSRADFGILEKELQLLKTLKTNFEDLNKKKENLQNLVLKKPQIDALQAEINEFEKIEKVFGKELSNLKQTSEGLKVIKEQYSKSLETYTIIEKSITENEKSLTDLKIQFDALEPNKSKVADLTSIEKILTYQSSILHFEQRFKAGELAWAEGEKNEKELKNKLKQLQEHLIAIKSNRIDTTVLLTIGNWYNNQQNHLKGLIENKRHIEAAQDAILKSKQSIEALGLPLENWRAFLAQKTEAFENQQKAFEEVRSQLNVAKELSHYVNNLHEGEDCPLCGSKDHPNIMQAEDVSEKCIENEKAISDCIIQLKTVQSTNLQAEKHQHSIAQTEVQLQELLSNKAILSTAVGHHLKQFIWPEYNANDATAFEAKKKEQQQLEANIKEAEDKAVVLDKLLETAISSLEKIKEAKNAIEKEKAAVEGALNNELLQLKALSFEDYRSFSVEEIQSKKTALKNENDRVETEFSTKSEVIRLEREKAATLKGTLISEKAQLDLYEKNHQNCQNQIAVLLNNHQYENLEIVRLILSKIWDVEKEKEKTKQFTIAIEISKSAVTEAEKLIEGQNFEIEIFEKKEALFKEALENVEKQLGIVSSLQSELAKQQEDLDKKKSLLIEAAVLESRTANLSTLANMFSGSGFVNYVSSIYLQNLSDVANVRFHRMTKNQLSLRINSSNEFEVVDYLNNGASRSVKTLSGGQGFQASLCLALALAESVQSLNKTNKNFFFIDEGFGTQDQESVTIVFETLQSLYKENRIVGIISHVAELQEQIPRSINVVKDEEKGSMINENWN